MTRFPSPRPSQAGFTLIELLIALAVMLVGLLALWSMHTAAITSNANAHRLGIATTLAQDAMESLLSEVFQDSQFATANGAELDLTTCGGPLDPPVTDGLEALYCPVDGVSVRVNGLGSTDVSLGSTIYLRSYQLEAMATPSGIDRLRIWVRVTYSEPGTAKRHGVTIATTRTADQYAPGTGA